MKKVNRNRLTPGQAYLHRGSPRFAGKWGVAIDEQRLLADREGLTALFETEQEAIDAYSRRDGHRVRAGEPIYNF